jgi:hypothetical protein
MLKSLRLRLERLEAARGRAVIEILREHPGGGADITVIRNGRVTRRREVTAEEAARLARGAITVERGYGLPTSEARGDLPPTEKI